MEAKFQPYSYFPSNPLVFKFCFLFIILFTLIFNNNTLWFISILTPITHSILISIIYFITQSKEGLPQSKFQLTNGSGDTLYAWYALLFILIIATLGAFFWHFLKRRDKSIPLLTIILTTIVRYYVGLMLFSYGLVKLFELQFSFPSITRLTEPLHQFSPMGLAWTFMGFSKGYNLTMGIIESCAILLLFKKTSTLGACISLMVSVQILLINYFFDVPVKMVSTALVLFSLLLLAPNFKNFYQLFFSSEPVILTKAKSYRSRRNWINKVLMIGKHVIIISCISIICFKTFSTKYYVSRMNSERNSFYGAYYIPNEESMQRTQLKIPFD